MRGKMGLNPVLPHQLWSHFAPLRYSQIHNCQRRMRAHDATSMIPHESAQFLYKIST